MLRKIFQISLPQDPPDGKSIIHNTYFQRALVGGLVGLALGAICFPMCAWTQSTREAGTQMRGAGIGFAANLLFGCVVFCAFTIMLIFSDAASGNRSGRGLGITKKFIRHMLVQYETLVLVPSILMACLLGFLFLIFPFITGSNIPKAHEETPVDTILLIGMFFFPAVLVFLFVRGVILTSGTWEEIRARKYVYYRGLLTVSSSVVLAGLGGFAILSWVPLDGWSGMEYIPFILAVAALNLFVGVWKGLFVKRSKIPPIPEWIPGPPEAISGTERETSL